MRTALPIVFALFSQTLWAEPVRCWYSPVGSDGLQAVEACATQHTSGWQMQPEHLSRMDFGTDGLAVVMIQSQWHYVKTDGQLLAVPTLDNGPDDFSEGLVRGWVNGKLGYFDANLRPVIAAQYDFGWPAQQGQVEVCQGCRFSQPDAEGRRGVIDGQWHSLAIPPQPSTP